MSAQHLISCLRRFAGRRGKINLFISDNFQTFLSDELKNFLSSNNINWKYLYDDDDITAITPSHLIIG